MVPSPRRRPKRESSDSSHSSRSSWSSFSSWRAKKKGEQNVTVDEVLEDFLQGGDTAKGLPVWEDPLTAPVAVPDVIHATSPTPSAGRRQQSTPKSGKGRAGTRSPRKAAPRQFDDMVISFDPDQLEKLEDISGDFTVQDAAARAAGTKSSSQQLDTAKTSKSPKAPANRRGHRKKALLPNSLSPSPTKTERQSESTTQKKSKRSPTRSSSMDSVPFQFDSGDAGHTKRSTDPNEISLNLHEEFVPVTPSFASKGDRKQTTKNSSSTANKTNGRFETSFSEIECDLATLQGNVADDMNKIYPKPEFAESFPINRSDTFEEGTQERRSRRPNGAKSSTKPTDESHRSRKNVRRGVSRNTSHDSYSQSTDRSSIVPTKPPAKSSRSGRRPRNGARRAVRQAVDDGWHVEDFDQPISALLHSSNHSHITSSTMMSQHTGSVTPDDGSVNRALLEQEEELIQLALERSLHDSSSFDTRSMMDQSACSLSLNGYEDALTGNDFDMAAALNATNSMMKDMFGTNDKVFDNDDPDLMWEKDPSSQGHWTIAPCLQRTTSQTEEEKLIEEATKVSVKEALHVSLDELCRQTPRIGGAYWAHH